MGHVDLPFVSQDLMHGGWKTCPHTSTTTTSSKGAQRSQQTVHSVAPLAALAAFGRATASRGMTWEFVGTRGTETGSPEMTRSFMLPESSS